MNLTDEQWALIQPLISNYILSGAASRAKRSPACGARGEGTQYPISNPQLHPERSRRVHPERSQRGTPERNVVQPKSLPRATGGRPPADPRATLNGILRKIRLAAPWYDLPPYTSDLHPSWQTCYLSLSRTPCGNAIVTGRPLVSWTTSTVCSTRIFAIALVSTCSKPFSSGVSFRRELIPLAVRAPSPLPLALQAGICISPLSLKTPGRAPRFCSWSRLSFVT